MASNFFTESANPLRVTLKEHDAPRDCASRAVQFTFVGPRGNEVPDAGVQVVLTGAAPSVTVGDGNVTSCVSVATSLTVMSVGHVICGALATGVGEFPPWPPQAATIITLKSAEKTINLLEII